MYLVIGGGQTIDGSSSDVSFEQDDEVRSLLRKLNTKIKALEEKLA